MTETDTAEMKGEAAVGRQTDDGEDAEIRLWLLRLLIPHGAYKQFFIEKEFASDDLACWLGFGDMLEDGGMAFNRQIAISRLQEAWEQAEAITVVHTPKSKEDKVVCRLGRQLGLSELETDILRFRLASERNRRLRTLLRLLGPQNLDSIVDILACCLNKPETEVRQGFANDSALISSGILELQARHSWWFNESISLIDCIAEETHLAHSDPIAYFRSRIVRSKPPRLMEENYPHVGRDIAVLNRFLADALVQRRPGVNVLIHGMPGSGKTELAHILAAAIGADLYEVATERRGANLLDGDERFRAYRIGQALLSRSGSHMILFDEIEDLFRESDAGPSTDANRSERKGAVNKILESNPVPAFWITNNIRVIDRSYLRRYDYVLELNAPPRSVRGLILEKYLDGLPVSDDWKSRMAEHEELVPAIVERAARVVRTAGENCPQVEVERNLSRIMGNTLEAMGLPREPRNWASLGEGYRLDVLNADCDMQEVLAGLVQHRHGRICLYGPPGTGKSAFGRYIAETLDRPLMVRRASDIVSPWVGMTEKYLARMFREALEEDAVLLLDEADSFLRDRQGAQQSWEVTEINEMLAQMECFEGLFIASTNLMDSLDAAALRRFDLKIRFDYLKSEQAHILFLDAALRLGLEVPKAIEVRLAGLECLTPGDFANVTRQARLRRIASANDLLKRLAAECAVKPEGKRRPIGFAVL